MSSADRLKLSLQPSPRGWTVPLLKSVFLCSRHSTPLRSSGLTTGRAFKPSWQLTLSQATEWPRYLSLTRPRLLYVQIAEQHGFTAVTSEGHQRAFHRRHCRIHAVSIRPNQVHCALGSTIGKVLSLSIIISK